LKPPTFSSLYSNKGRIGQFKFEESKIMTPILFPVACLITGPTPRGGGIWKYVVHADEANSLLRRNLPILTQVLHFLDFRSVTPKSFLKWRSLGPINRYRDEVQPPIEYSAPLFLDSGGFKLLWNQNIELSGYELSISDGNGPKTILDLQRDYGGQLVASLDYPLPPGLSNSEARERMRKSLENAVLAGKYLAGSSDYQPFLYVATHGQDRGDIGLYVQQVFKKFQKNGIMDYPFGLAVGSLVPLRGSRKYSKIINLLLGLRDNIPESLRNQIPIHVFGITGNLVPLLAYLGIDSFDSSTYIQNARTLKYIDPDTRRTRLILEMNEWTCQCRVCRRISLDEIHDALTSEIRNRPLPTGYYKSKYYGDIALHNLEIDFKIVQETRHAIEQDSLVDYLVDHGNKFPEVSSALDVIAYEDSDLAAKLNRKTIHLPFDARSSFAEGPISLSYTPESFNLFRKKYDPPKEKRILLVIPCSGGKPYSTSKSHRLITKRLQDKLGDKYQIVHKVTLSGLYGPVPEEYEGEEAVVRYDFRLDARDQAQLNLLIGRFNEFLIRFGDHYQACFGYATSLAYRKVLEAIAQGNSKFMLFPDKPKSRRLTEFFRQDNIQELMQAIYEEISID
jgi:7-cyano-7-deazaguanine tRNA-ribosyltransferase